jgi:hypothetical protein
MECPECHRLQIEREYRQLVYTTAALRMKAVETDWDTTEYVKLRAEAVEAELDLKLVDAEIAQHQDRHAVPLLHSRHGPERDSRSTAQRAQSTGRSNHVARKAGRSNRYETPGPSTEVAHGSAAGHR